MTNICYYCGNEATSDEHVPPKALFPKTKDSPDGRDYRRNLITVRSCDLHNTVKSRDDEYLLYILAMSLPSNELAKHHFLTKVQRAINYRPKLLEALLINFKPVTLHDTANNTWHRSIAVEPDEVRLVSLFTHIAMAIYFLETGRVWGGKVSVLIEFMLSMTDIERNETQTQMVNALNDTLAGTPHQGNHLDVFSYQFVELEGQVLLRMHFYGDSKVSAVYA